MKDQYGRTVDYLRLSVTDLCNYRCRYCMPPEGVEKLPHSSILSLEEYVEIAAAAVGLGITKIRVTGGEPLVSSAGRFGPFPACGSSASPPTEVSSPLWPPLCGTPGWTG